MPKQISLKARALRYLAVREYAPQELMKRLVVYAQNEDELKETIAWLIEKDFLSEARFVESFVRQKSGKYGDKRILYELSQRDISSELLNHAKEILQESENERVRVVWQKKFGTLPKDFSEKKKQIQFLRQRGFSESSIYAVFKNKLD